MSGLQMIYIIFALIPILEVLFGVFLATGIFWFISRSVEIWRKRKDE